MNAAPDTNRTPPSPSHPRWEAIKPGLRAQIPDPFFRTFIQPLVAVAGEPADTELSLIVPDEKLLEHIKLRYIKIIEDSLRAADYRGSVNLLPQKSKLACGRTAPTAAADGLQAGTDPQGANAPGEGAHVSPTASASPACAAETVRTTNQATEAPPEFFIAPHQPHPPLDQLRGLEYPGCLALVTGGNGYGKTTLGRDLAARPGARYLSLETFLTEFSLACREKTALAWRSDIRAHRLLVIDDFQFVKKGAGHSQEEIRNLIDEFESQGRKLVLCSDRPFSELPLSDTLRSRFFSGFRVDLPPPDFGTRLEILKRETGMLGHTPAHEDLIFLARNIAGDARKLRSAAQRLCYAPESGGGVAASNPARLEDICRDLFTIRPEIAPEIILKTVAAHYRTTPEAVAGPSRDKKNALARHLVATLCIDLAGRKFNEAARLIGRKDHTCVVHARKKIAALVEADLFFRQEVEDLKSQVLRSARLAD